MAAEGIGDYRNAVRLWREAADVLAALAAERADRKMRALLRLCDTTHPVSGRAFSVSQADDLLQLDEEYAVYKQRVGTAERNVREAEYRLELSRLVAAYALAAFETDAGVIS